MDVLQYIYLWSQQEAKVEKAPKNSPQITCFRYMAMNKDQSESGSVTPSERNTFFIQCVTQHNIWNALNEISETIGCNPDDCRTRRLSFARGCFRVETKKVGNPVGIQDWSKRLLSNKQKSSGLDENKRKSRTFQMSNVVIPISDAHSHCRNWILLAHLVSSCAC